MPVPAQPKIYHIVHVDRLASIIADKRIWCDAKVILITQASPQCSALRYQLDAKPLILRDSPVKPPQD